MLLTISNLFVQYIWKSYMKSIAKIERAQILYLYNKYEYISIFTYTYYNYFILYYIFIFRENINLFLYDI